ncbi:helix-turn-helix domain-containing protein [Pelagibacteraceae bacterium]|nr:helix-turn-helix domain-containing protein [Pelagibacteraceae bacterium]
MKHDLDIYTNLNRTKILYELFYDFNINIKKISEIINEINSNNCGLVMLDKDNDVLPFLLIKQSRNKIFLINKTYSDKYKSLQNIVEANVNISKLRSKIANLFSNQKYLYKDLKIIDNKIVNVNKGAELTVTEIEKKILIKLFNKKSYSKKIFKEEILNIKNNIETNSLDSHLTRIRKKLREIKSNVVLISKNEFILIQ